MTMIMYLINIPLLSPFINHTNVHIVPIRRNLLYCSHPIHFPIAAPQLLLLTHIFSKFKVPYLKPCPPPSTPSPPLCWCVCGCARACDVHAREPCVGACVHAHAPTKRPQNLRS